ncbi:hypothetical protein FHU14_003157 [Mesorhizobium sp. RMAD-H1]|nr:hypothetical protein [Mesorhizobium sp. RMAD-H1]
MAAAPACDIVKNSQPKKQLHFSVDFLLHSSGC